MKKLLAIVACLLPAIAFGQFTPGQILTAAQLNSQFALYAPLTGATFTGGISATGITGTPINGAAGSFTNLSASGTVTLPNASITLANLANQAANTVLANVTAWSASSTAVALPSCSTAASALNYTTSSGFSCNTAINASQLGGTAAASYALLASPTFTGTPAAPTAATNTNTTQLATTAFVEGEFANPPAAGFGSTTKRPVGATTITATSTITPSTTAGIVGTATNDNANAGSWGEYQSITGGSSSISTTTNTNMTSLSLGAGDWDVEGVVSYTANAGTTVTAITSGISTTSSTPGPLGSTGASAGSYTSALGAVSQPSPVVRVSLASTTTVYLVGLAVFSGGTCNAQGFMRARRVR